MWFWETNTLEGIERLVPLRDFATKLKRVALKPVI